MSKINWCKIFCFKRKGNVWPTFGTCPTIYFLGWRLDLISPFAVWKIYKNSKKIWTKDAWKSAFTNNLMRIDEWEKCYVILDLKRR